jgi:hypothetical protein
MLYLQVLKSYEIRHEELPGTSQESLLTGDSNSEHSVVVWINFGLQILCLIIVLLQGNSGMKRQQQKINGFLAFKADRMEMTMKLYIDQQMAALNVSMEVLLNYLIFSIIVHKNISSDYLIMFVKLKYSYGVFIVYTDKTN